MATVYSLPPAAAAPEAGTALHFRRRSEYDLGGVAAKLKLTQFEPRTIVAKIRVLIERYGFPPPITPRIVKGERKTGAEAVYAKSKWNRDDVDQWCDDDLPPAAAARAERVNREEVRAQLAGRAGRLVA